MAAAEKGSAKGRAAEQAAEQAAVPPPIVLLIGDEALLVRQAEERMVAAAFEGKISAFNMASYTADTGGWAALDAARTLPMMARRRVVILRDMDKASTELLDALMDYADKPNPSTALLLVGVKLPGAVGGMDRGKRLENKLKPTGGVFRFKSADSDPVAFAIERAGEGGCTMDRRAASLLVELVGADLGRVAGEVEKAIAYVGGKGPIDEGVVEQVCSLVAEAVIWTLTDAVLARDADRALGAMHRLLEDGEPSHRLLSMVTWQIRQLLELQDAIRKGNPEPGSWARMPYQKKNAARAILSRHPLVPHKVLGAIVKANREMNRSPAGDRRIFESLILSLTAA